jgi:predicted TPR repeat methyltransferase
LNIPEEINKAVQFHIKGQLDEAEALYKKVLIIQPNNPDALNLLGVVCFQIGDLKSSEELINKAIEEKPSNPNFHNNLGNTLRNSGKVTQAELSYRKALELDPQNSEAHANLAIVLRDLRQPDLAIEFCYKAIVLNPKIPQPYNTLGNLLCEQMEWEKAEVVYKKALEIKPFPEAFNNLGNVLKDLGKLDDAVFSYQNAVSLNPNYAEAFNNLGNVLKLLNQLGEAKEAYDRAVAIWPEFSEAHYNLAILFKESEHLAAAEKEYRLAAELDPSNLSAKHMLSALSRESVEAAPLEYVEGLFDRFAPTFDEELVNKLSYSTPDLLKELLSKETQGEFKYQNAVDLGCGTGLSGLAIRCLSHQLTGIDVSKKMLAVAGKKNVYDKLWQGEICEALSANKETFDLFFAADVFVYIGSLESVFKVIKQHARKGALFVFSTESHPGNEDFDLRITGRFAHSRNYIKNIAQKTGLMIKQAKSGAIRKDKGKWIKGDLFVLKAKSA